MPESHHSCVTYHNPGSKKTNSKIEIKYIFIVSVHKISSSLFKYFIIFDPVVVKSIF